MENMSLHMRISGINVTDADVSSRIAVATSLKSKWIKEKNLESVITNAVEIAKALGGGVIPPPKLGAEVEAAIRKKSPSYLLVERPLDIGICAGMAIVSLLDSSRSTIKSMVAETYGLALWSTLSYQPVLDDERREKLRCEVLNAASSWSRKSAEKARERIDVPDLPAIKITISDSGEVSNNIGEAITNSIKALRCNAALDREEIDFLWWAQLGRSRLLDKQLASISEITRIVAAGIEGASMLRGLPCEVHREIVLRTLDQDPSLDLAELIAALGDDRVVLGEAFIEGCVITYPTVFPLLHALATGKTGEKGAAEKRDASEWGTRALLEAGFANMMMKGKKNL